MNLDQLGKTIEQNKPAALAVAAAGVVGFALMRRKSGGAAAPAASVQTAPVMSAGGQAASMGGAYDSSASDLYGAVQPQMESIAAQFTSLNDKLNAVPVSAPPTASQLTNPTYDGQYVRAAPNAGGLGPGIFEVESDGSLLHLTQSQWDTALVRGGVTPNTPQAAGMFTDLAKDWNGNWYDTSANIGALSSGKGTGTPVTMDKNGRVLPVPVASAVK